MRPGNTPRAKSRVWDVPTRLFHWLLAAAVLVAWLTREEDRLLDVHAFAGYAALGLLAFRILWGSIGTRYARFRQFAYGPAAVRAHLAGVIRGHALRHVGHNPAGAWAIFGLLVLIGALGATGLIVLGGEEQHGPLAGLFTHEQGGYWHEVHRWLAFLLAALVLLHIAGVITESRLLNENLIGAMWHGKKLHPAPGVPARLGTGVALLALLVLAAGVYFRGYIGETAAAPYRPYVGMTLPDDPVWRSECGTCHLAFHPSLLPARSWQRLLGDQDRHFGDDLALSADTLAALARYAQSQSAERRLTEAAWRIDTTTPATQAPLRVTETPYWKRKHRTIPETRWTAGPIHGRSDCAACHLDADLGTFEDAAMRMPNATSDISKKPDSP